VSYSASLQWLCDHAALIRIHPGEGKGLGDPYVWTATVKRDGDRAEIMGVTKPLPCHARPALLACLSRAGIARVTYRRISGDKERVITRETSKARPTSPEPAVPMVQEVIAWAT
jgi:hypothetical protein